MSSENSISDKVIEFLAASEGEEGFEDPMLFELFYLPDSESINNLEAGVSITRSIDDPAEFLISSITSLHIVDKPDGGKEFKYMVEPCSNVLGYLELDPKDLPIYDECHFGPLSSEQALGFLKLLHATNDIRKAYFKAEALKDKFLQSVKPDSAAPQEELHPTATDGNVAYPAQWNSQPEA